MKICFISPLLQNVYFLSDLSTKYPPLGLGYIASVLEKNNRQVKIIERKLFVNLKDRGEYLRGVDRKTANELAGFDPDIVGITSTTPAVMDAFHVAKMVKILNEKTLVVIGGTHPSIMAEQTLRQCPDIDIVCRGEGEFTFLEIASGKDLGSIDGITYRNGANKDRKPIEDLDRLPYPARNLFNNDYYFSKNVTVMRGILTKATTIFTARGCPFGCSFCLSTAMGKNVRLHSPEYIADEIEYLISKYNINAINILDDIFAINKQRAISICKTFIKRGLNKKIKYNINLRVDTVDMELLDILKKSGCVNVVYGCESGSQDTLKIMNKHTTVMGNMATIKATKRAKITCDVNILIGMPGEKEKNILETIKFLKRTRPDKIRLAKLYPLPGTAVFNDLVKSGILKKEYDDWNEISNKYDVGDFTFADIPYERFRYLKNKMNKEIILPTNYLFSIKANLRDNPMHALKYLIFMILHLSFLSLPMFIQQKIKDITERISHRLRYIFR